MMRRTKSDPELTRRRKYRDEDRRPGYQLYETIVKAVRITLKITNKTQLPFDLENYGTLYISLRYVAPFVEEQAHSGCQNIPINLCSHTCNETISWISDQDLGRNTELVASLKINSSDNEMQECDPKRIRNEHDESTVDIAFKNNIQFTVQINKDKKPDIESRDCYTLSVEEQRYCNIRKQKVFEEMRKNLTEDIVSTVENVPNIAIIGSGGGMRAVIGMSGAMSALQKLHILDYSMYTAGLSGSAWYLMTLYANDDEFNPKKVNGHIRGRLHNNSRIYILMGVKILMRFAYVSYFGSGSLTCTDLFGEMIGRILLGEKCKNKWSEQAIKFEKGCIPLPLIAALHVRLERTRHEYNEWIEISPYQVLLPSYGAAIKMSTFGDGFNRGFRTKEFEETPIHFLKGICGSAYAIARDQRPEEQSIGSMYLRDRMMRLANKFDLSIVARIPNVLRSIWGLKKIPSYQDNDQFTKLHERYRYRCKCRGSVLGMCCRKIENWIWMLVSAIGGPALQFLINLFGFTPSDRLAEEKVKDDENMLIVDAGIEFNSPYPLVLHPARRVNLIISFDFSDRDRDGELPFGELIKAAHWAKQRGVSFPELYPDIEEMEKMWIDGNRKEVYIFKGDMTTPTIMHFVMINHSFRNTDAEHKFDIHPTYGTLRFSYSTEEFDKFKKMVKHNVVKNQEKIFRCIAEEIHQMERMHHMFDHMFI